MRKVPRISFTPDQGVLLVIDVQPSLMPHIFEGDRVLDRVKFLAKIAGILDVPILTTEQNPSRMGGTHDEIAPLVGEPFAKMCFGACGCEPFMDALRASGRTQVVIVGVETHICVGQTAQGLLETGYEVAVCPDGVSSRTVDRHKLGMERIRDAGIVPAHTEAVAYEWLGSADHPKFRDALRIVKEHP